MTNFFKITMRKDFFKICSRRAIHRLTGGKGTSDEIKGTKGFPYTIRIVMPKCIRKVTGTLVKLRRTWLPCDMRVAIIRGLCPRLLSLGTEVEPSREERSGQKWEPTRYTGRTRALRIKRRYYARAKRRVCSLSSFSRRYRRPPRRGGDAPLASNTAIPTAVIPNVRRLIVIACLPTTTRFFQPDSVENVGASAVTSHEKFPITPKSTFRIVTWLSFDFEVCNRNVKE